MIFKVTLFTCDSGLQQGDTLFSFQAKIKVKIKVTVEQATKAQRGSRGIALLFP
jgi:hypothetical protein